MVKILCASQEYLQWDIFLIFTCNMRKSFGTKPVLEWLDDNKWKMHFPNWDTYYLFSAEINKKSTTSICFGPISTSLGRSQCYFYWISQNNITSSPFMKMLAVFAWKENQSDVGNISHIHLFGKLCQLSEQSQTELFDLIRNNVVNIIKPEEFDDLIREGIIEHKYHVIQVQLDGLKYLIHTCNSQCLDPDKYGKLICHATNYQKS